jgi:tRNA G37 N-methylase Trm5
MVWPGDNARLAAHDSPLLGCADRVVLGLIPSSARAWPAALRLLKPAGGVLHVHMNQADADASRWAADELPRVFERLAVEAGRPDWRATVLHLERVKSYAPHVSHYVADLLLCPLVGKP